MAVDLTFFGIVMKNDGRNSGFAFDQQFKGVLALECFNFSPKRLALGSYGFSVTCYGFAEEMRPFTVGK